MSKRCTVILVLVLFLSGVELKAQSKFGLGFHLGTTNSNIAKMDGAEGKSKFGNMLGAYLRYGERWYGELGINYYDDKSEITINDPTIQNQQVDLNFSSYNTSLLVGYKIVDEDDFKIRISAGSLLFSNFSVNDNDLFD